MSISKFEEQSRVFGIGNTPLIRAKSLEKILGFKKIFLKNEGFNPTKTYKDRHALMQVLLAKDKGYKTITVGTCGNYGVAIARYATEFELDATVYVPKKYSNSRLDELKSFGAGLIKETGEYEDIVRLSIESAKKNNWYDANNGANLTSSLDSCAFISKEIVSELGEIDTLSVPVGNGTLLSGIHRGFQDLKRKDVILKMPHIIGSSTHNSNAVIESFRKNQKKVQDLNPNHLKLTDVNEPLIAFHCFGGQLALDAIYNTKGYATGFTDEKMIEYKNLILEAEGIDTLPASASALGGLVEFQKINGLKEGEGINVVVLTGSI